MSRARKPVAVLRAEGSRHYTKAELARREAAEVHPPAATEVKAPNYLPVMLRDKFELLAPVLVQMGVLSEVDADGLARYLLAEANYLRVTSRLTTALNVGNLDDAGKLSAMQDRFFRQCRAAGADLGLTVSGRCKLEVPAPGTPDADDGRDLFGC